MKYYVKSSIYLTVTCHNSTHIFKYSIRRQDGFNINTSIVSTKIIMEFTDLTAFLDVKDPKFISYD